MERVSTPQCLGVIDTFHCSSLRRLVEKAGVLALTKTSSPMGLIRFAVKCPTSAPEQYDNLLIAVCSLNAIDAFDPFERAETAITKELGLYAIFLSRG